MFNNSETLLQKLTTEMLVNVASFLDLASILQFSLTGKPYSHLIKDELLYKQLNKRDFGVSEKSPEQTWLDVYKQLNVKDVAITGTSSQPAAAPQPSTQPSVPDTTQPTINTTEITPSTNQFTAQETATDACPHFEPLTDFAREVKKILFKSEESYLCDLCSNNPATYLSMHHDDHTGGEQCSILICVCFVGPSNQPMFLLRSMSVMFKPAFGWPTSTFPYSIRIGYGRFILLQM